MVRGMQEVLKWLGGRKEWNNELEEMLKVKLEEQGLGKKKEKIEAQMKIALEAYTQPASEERKIITAQKGGLRGYLELCKHHDLRTAASANRLRSEIMELGKACKSRKEVKEGLINLEAKRTRLAEMVTDKNNELQPTWLKMILVQMLDKETKLHIGEEIGKDEVTYQRNQ